MYVQYELPKLDFDTRAEKKWSYQKCEKLHTNQKNGLSGCVAFSIHF